jgi:hypothetical protein
MSRNDFQISQIASKDLAPWAFIFFGVIGTILIGISKWMLFPTFVIILIPFLVLLGYTFVSLTLPRLELRRDQIGDNAYYLGFILTLVSLLITLTQFSSNADDGFIVSNFGTALISTVLGIAIRSVISQFRKDLVGVERDMHASLREASMQLRSQIFTSVEMFGSLHRQMAQITEEAVGSVAAAHSAFAEGLHVILDDRIVILDKQVEVSSLAIETRIAKMVSEIETASRAFTEGTQAEQKALADTAAAVKKSLSQFETITLDTTSLKNVEAALVEFTESISTKLSSSALAASKHAETITTSSQSMSEVAKSTQTGIKKQLAVIDKQIVSMTSAADEIEALQNKFIGMKDTYRKALEEGSDAVLKSTKNFDGKLNEQVELIVEHVKSLKESAGEISTLDYKTPPIEGSLKTDNNASKDTDPAFGLGAGSVLDTKKKPGRFW